MKEEGPEAPLYFLARGENRLEGESLLPQRGRQTRHGYAPCVCDKAKFSEQLSKIGVNLDLIDFLNRKVATNVMLRECRLKYIADEFPMKEAFEKWLQMSVFFSGVAH